MLDSRLGVWFAEGDSPLGQFDGRLESEMLVILWMHSDLRRLYLASDNPHGPEQLRRAVIGYDLGPNFPRDSVRVVLPMMEDAGEGAGPVTAEIKGVPPDFTERVLSPGKRQAACDRTRQHLVHFLLAQRGRATSIEVMDDGPPNLRGYRFTDLNRFFERIGDVIYQHPNAAAGVVDDLRDDRHRLS